MIGSTLTGALNQEFFRWFSLERYEPPQALADGRTWHGFRPSGEKFQSLVTVNLETDPGDRIGGVTVSQLRRGIDRRRARMRRAHSENRASAGWPGRAIPGAALAGARAVTPPVIPP